MGQLDLAALRADGASGSRAAVVCRAASMSDCSTGFSFGYSHDPKPFLHGPPCEKAVHIKYANWYSNTQNQSCEDVFYLRQPARRKDGQRRYAQGATSPTAHEHCSVGKPPKAALGPKRLPGDPREQGHRLHVLGMRKHIHRDNALELVGILQHLDVACLGKRVAADVDDALRSSSDKPLDELL